LKNKISYHYFLYHKLKATIIKVSTKPKKYYCKQQQQGWADLDLDEIELYSEKRIVNDNSFNKRLSCWGWTFSRKCSSHFSRKKEKSTTQGYCI